MHLPISMRTAAQLRDRAEELRRMALTARTADTKTSLIALAERFDAIARKKSCEPAVIWRRSAQLMRRLVHACPLHPRTTHRGHGRYRSECWQRRRSDPALTVGRREDG